MAANAPPAEDNPTSIGCGCVAYILWTLFALLVGVLFVLNRLDVLAVRANSLRVDLLAKRITPDEYNRLVTEAQAEQFLYIGGWLALWLVGLALIWLLTRRRPTPVDEEDYTPWPEFKDRDEPTPK
jgi:hypothetical protein